MLSLVISWILTPSPYGKLCSWWAGPAGCSVGGRRGPQGWHRWSAGMGSGARKSPNNPNSPNSSDDWRLQDRASPRTQHWLGPPLWLLLWHRCKSTLGNLHSPSSEDCRHLPEWRAQGGRIPLPKTPGLEALFFVFILNLFTGPWGPPT